MGRARRDAWQGDREAFAQARLAALQAGLQLTEQQQTLWAPVAAAIRTVQSLHDHHGGRGPRSAPSGQDGAQGAAADGLGDLSALKEHSARMVATGKAMESLADSVGPFVASLTPDQKHRLPILLDGMRPHRILREAFGLADDEGWMGHRHGGMDGASYADPWHGEGSGGERWSGGGAPPWARGMTRDGESEGDD